MSAVRVALLGLGFLLAGCAAPRAAEPCPAELGTEIEAVCRAQEAAWNRGDLEAFMALGYWNSEGLTFFSGHDVSRGFQPILERYRKRYQSDGQQMGKLSFSHLDVVPLADGVALLRGRWDLDFEKDADVGGLFTLVLRRFAAGWRIVHDHTSV